jgi:hypothetical protein
MPKLEQVVEAVAVVVKSMEHIVVGQQHIGHSVGIGFAVGIAGKGYSWHMAVVKIAYAEESAGGKNLQDWVLLLTHLDYSYDLMNHQAGVNSFVTRGNCSPEN